MQVKKSDTHKQIIYAEVYVPMVLDSEGDFMTAEDIETMAHNFARNNRFSQVDVMHDNKLYGCHIIESFIARDCDDLFIPGSWVVAIHIPSPVIWAKVLDGTFNGLSVQAQTMVEDVEFWVEEAQEIYGLTSETHGHSHSFSVIFDPHSNKLRGATSFDNGHQHAIQRGTITDEADGHTHRFSFVEGLVSG